MQNRLNTDKAWEVYDYLVDFYFRAKEGEKIPVVKETKTGDNRKTGLQKSLSILLHISYL